MTRHACASSARRYRGPSVRRTAGAGNPPAWARSGVMSDPVLGATNCRFCNAPLELTVIDLGKSPLCELPRGRPARDDGGLLSAARPNVLTLLARPAAGLRRACRDLRGVRILLGLLGLVGRACSHLRRDDLGAARLDVRQPRGRGSPRTTGTCSSTSCPGVFQCSGSIRLPTLRARRRSGVSRRSSISSASSLRSAWSTRGGRPISCWGTTCSRRFPT